MNRHVFLICCLSLCLTLIYFRLSFRYTEAQAELEKCKEEIPTIIGDLQSCDELFECFVFQGPQGTGFAGDENENICCRTCYNEEMVLRYECIKPTLIIEKEEQ
jgi:hypothetical protein